MAAVTLVASFTNPRAYWSSLAVGALANLVLAFLAVSLWALFGTVVKTWLSNSLRRRLFNWAMAAALVLSVLPALFSDAR
jgi:threonine/homoserine/homoserine lactone efflux protein